jgi:hypothetical protein
MSSSCGAINDAQGANIIAKVPSIRDDIQAASSDFNSPLEAAPPDFPNIMPRATTKMDSFL